MKEKLQLPNIYGSQETFLLYIDILGFSSYVEEGKIDLIEEIYKQIKSHLKPDRDFEVIVFSDTALVYPKRIVWDEITTVMFLIEYVEALFHALSYLNVQFRAVIVCDQFHHRIEDGYFSVFYGKSLVRAHNKEKELNCIGLFIDSRIAHYNEIYTSIEYSQEFSFVFLERAFQRLISRINESNSWATEHSFPVDNLPVSMELLDDNLNDLVRAIRYFKNVYEKANDRSLDDRTRQKYLQLFDLYRSEYTSVFDSLVASGFDFKSIIRDIDDGVVESILELHQ